MSTPLASSSLQTDHTSVTDMNAASGTPISADHSVKISTSHLQGTSTRKLNTAVTDHALNSTIIIMLKQD